MALISTYWGLVRPLRHHFIGPDRKPRPRQKSTYEIDPRSLDSNALPVDRCARAPPRMGEGVGGERRPPSAGRGRPSLDHPLLGNAATHVTRGKSRPSIVPFRALDTFYLE